VVACALDGGTEYLVTDDRRDLLPLKVIRMSGYRPVQVMRMMSWNDTRERFHHTRRSTAASVQRAAVTSDAPMH
jgi:hypothetical protein